MAEPTRTVPVAVVESDPDLRPLLGELVRRAGGIPLTFATADIATEAVAQRRVAAVLLGLDSQDDDDVRALTGRAQQGALPVAVLASVRSLDQASRLLSLGPIDHINSPLGASALLEELSRFVAGAKERAFLVDLRETLARDWTLSHRLLGFSPALNSVLRALPRLAAQDAPVLIVGERATGRRRLAEVIHDLSPRAAQPCIVFECGATADDAFEERLFGAAFAQAAAGTLVLRDVEEIPLAVQARLVAILDGGGDPRLATRLIATSQDALDRRVDEGRFREPLYKALASQLVRVPALRERREDIPVLANAALASCCDAGSTSARAFTPKALEILVEADWPGNVSELEDAVTQAAGRATGALITPKDLGRPSAEAPDSLVDTSLPFHEAKAALIARFEREYAERMLEDHRGNVSAAARTAGLDRRSLTRLLERHGFRRNG